MIILEHFKSEIQKMQYQCENDWQSGYQKALDDILHMFNSITPIELPSDEEIGKYIEKTFYGEKKHYFKAGVEFMKEQILNQNNNNERTTTDNDRVY